MGSNPVEASDLFLGFRCFTTAKITFTSIQTLLLAYGFYGPHTLDYSPSQLVILLAVKTDW